MHLPPPLSERFTSLLLRRIQKKVHSPKSPLNYGKGEPALCLETIGVVDASSD